MEDLSTSEQQIINVINSLQTKCFNAAAIKGFWQEYDQIIGLLSEEAPGLVKAAESMMVGQKIALMHSEASEALEGSRKDAMSDKLPGFTAEEEEIADFFIRGLDFAGKRHLRIGLAIVLKMRYNAGRPFMHGKKF